MDLNKQDELISYDDFNQLSLKENLSSLQMNSVREELVNTAVSFLLNPKIQNTSLAQKKGFLLNKGLNNDEIELALERTLLSLNSINNDQFNQHHINNVPLNPLFYRPPTFWSITRLITPSVILIFGLFYGIYTFYEKFIKQLIYGQKACENSIEIVRTELSFLKDSIKNLEVNLFKIEENIKKNLELELNQSKYPNPAEIAAINELKQEITSIKSLMLNKDQFPSITKTITSGIPEWQKPKNEEKVIEKKETEEDKKIKLENEKKIENISKDKKNKKKKNEEKSEELTDDKLNINVIQNKNDLLHLTV